MKSKCIDVLRALKEYEDKNQGGLRPSLKELAWAIEHEHASSVVGSVNMLERYGYITRELSKTRTIKTTETGRKFLESINDES